MPSPINTVEGYLQALNNFDVGEVSDNLFINFPQPTYLYQESLPIGWIGTNHNLYQLLELNQRFQDEAKTITAGEHFQTSAKAFASLFRNIGFGADASADFGPFYVFDRNATTTTTPLTNEGIELSYAANVQLPTLEGFEQVFALDLIRYAGWLPSKVEKYNDQLKSIWSSMRNDIFSGSWTRGNTLSMYLQYLGGKPGYSLDFSSTNFLANLTLADITQNNADAFAQQIGATNPDDFFEPGGKALYGWWQELASTYGDLLFFVDDSNENAPATFFFQSPASGGDNFSDLITDLLDKYTTDSNADYQGYGSVQDVLEATLRFYYQFNYQASALNTQNSLPYSNSANPFVIGSFDQLNTLDWGQSEPNSWQEIFGNTWFDTFSGNEAWVGNLEVDSLVSGKITGTTSDAAKAVYAGVYQEGWTPLSTATFVPIVQGIDGDDSHGYQNIYFFNDQSDLQSQAVVFGRSTNSSDTLTATYLDSNSSNIDPNTRLQDGRTIGSLDGLVNSQGVLPDSFRSYISLSGGVDRVTGSKYADVIVGTTVQNGNVTPGSLNAMAGDGDDVVAPGRGSGTISLGGGRDKLVIDQDDTLGRTTLFDFNFYDDELVVHPDLNVAIDVNNNSLLYVFKPGAGQEDDIKTLHLTQSSSDGGGTGWHDYFDNYADWILKNLLVTRQPMSL